MQGLAMTRGGALLAFALSALLSSTPALAQTTGASIQGTVSDDSGVLPGANVVARETSTGLSYEAVTSPEGFFALSGLRPGAYEITVSMPQYKPQAKAVQLVVGQNVTLAFRVTPDMVYAEQVT